MSGSRYSRQRPFPWDGELDLGDGSGWHGLMFVPGQDGLLVGRQVQSLGRIVPSTYSYANQDPAIEATFTFGNLIGGMGEAVQQSGLAPTRYRFALGVDASIGGKPRLGPLFVPEALPAPIGVVADVQQFVVGPGESTDALFCLRGQGVYIRIGGAWTLSKDFGAFNYPQQAVVFQGTAGNRRLWVSTALGELWGFGGATWTKATLPGYVAAQFVERVGRELFIGSNSTVANCTADPLATWNGAIQVGDHGSRITYLKSINDEILIFKEDGVYSLNPDGSDNELFSELRAHPLLTNGQHATVWKDRVYFRHGSEFYRMDAAATLEPIGPERLVDLDPTIQGASVSAAGWADWFLWHSTYRAVDNTSFLLKFGTWTNTDAPISVAFQEAWHGAVASWVGKAISRLDVIHLDGESMLWAGFVDGTIEMAVLPTLSPDPSSNASCRFVPSGSIYWPRHHAGYAVTQKSWHAFSVFARGLVPGVTVEQFYLPPGGVTYVSAGVFTASGQRIELPNTLADLSLDTYTVLQSTQSTLTPILDGVGLSESIRPHAPTQRLSWTFSVAARTNIPRRDGVVSRMSPVTIRNLLRLAAEQPGMARWRFPEEIVTGSLVTYGESLANADHRKGYEWTIPVELVGFK